MRVCKAIELLRRFPQDAFVTVIGDRGMEDLRVEVYDEKAERLHWYRFDAPDHELPWLTT